MGKIEKTAFGQNGASLYRLHNRHGMQVTVTDFGARIVEVLLPVTGEGLRNVTLACASAEEYLAQDAYVGASILPVAGRISGASTEISGQTYHFTENEPNRTLHGGVDTTNLHLWQTEIDEAANQISFTYQLPDGKNGFPGTISVTATYTLTEDNGVRVSYRATSDKDTVFNPTNHVYFNLTGDVHQTVGQHRLQIAADRFAVLNGDNVPSGELRAVEGTPFDFRKGGVFEQGLTSDYEQIKLVQGFDHPWLLEDAEQQVVVTSPDDKVTLTLQTNQPSVVIYTYNHGPTDLAAQHGVFSLECQALPDACNQEGFGSILLAAGEKFTSETEYQFSWK